MMITSEQTIDTKLAHWHYGLAETTPTGKRERLFIASWSLSIKTMTIANAAAAVGER